VSAPVILLDTSSSMNDLAGYRRRIDVLRSVLDQVLPGCPNARLFAFDSVCREIDGAKNLPRPEGGTALDHAIEQVTALQPEPLVIITDGEPNNPDMTVIVAREARTHIVVHFVGDDKDQQAIQFCRQLAWASTNGLGEYHVTDLRHPERLAQNLKLWSGVGSDPGIGVQE
jgi:hypothetical protein